VAENPALEQEPFESVFREDYGRLASLADLFRRIGYDERVHKLESDSAEKPSVHPSRVSGRTEEPRKS